MDSDVSSIETRLLSQLSSVSKIPSPSQPRQAGILSKEKARRRVLLGSTVLGIVGIGSSLPWGNFLLFLIGNGIILLGSNYIWRNYPPRLDRKLARVTVNILYWSSCVSYVLWCYKFVSIGGLDWRVGLWDLRGPGLLGVFFLIIYLISTYIGRW